MNIIEDTRNQIGKHELLNIQLKELGHKVFRSKLPVGDYNEIGSDIYVDTKKDILELISNVTKQHERFKNEIELSNELGVKLVFLIEEIPPNNDLKQWVSPTKKDGKPLTTYKGETLEKALITIKTRYKVRFVFCSKQNTAKVLLSLFEEKQCQGKSLNKT